MAQQFQPGDWVVYRKTKRGPAPGPRAQQIMAAPKGETYAYMVDKFWIVEQADDQRVRLRTRRGKVHELPSDDPNLRKANLLERILYRHRFTDISSRLPRQPQAPHQASGLAS